MMNKYDWQYVSQEWVNNQTDKLIKGLINPNELLIKIKNKCQKCNFRRCKYCEIFYIQKKLPNLLKKLGFKNINGNYKVYCNCGFVADSIKEKNEHIKKDHNSNNEPIAIQYPVSNRRTEGILSGLMTPK